MFSFFRGLIYNLPTRKSLSVNWNYGSMLSFALIFQLLSGLFLAFFFVADGGFAFGSVQYIMYETNFGWFFRLAHANGASLFFFFLFLHFFKALFFQSYRLSFVWSSGLVILILFMAEAFIGYVLVWAQIRFWASVVITRLLSVIPFFGPQIVVWVWGGFGVSSATLKFFFVIHFLLPWALLLVVLAHLVFLHDTGRTSKLFCHGDYDKIFFFPFYWWKDSYNVFFFVFFFFFVSFFPYTLGDPEMYIEADPLSSPVHIVPEWYFLFAYAILRAIPNKVLGVLALLFSLLFFFLFFFVSSYCALLDKLNKFFVFLFFFCGLLLSWLGQCLVEVPFLFLSGLFSFFYFFLLSCLLFFYFFTSFLFWSVIIISKDILDLGSEDFLQFFSQFSYFKFILFSISCFFSGFRFVLLSCFFFQIWCFYWFGFLCFCSSLRSFFVV